MILISKSQILTLHSQLISETGGSDGLRDEPLLDSALNAPFQSFGDVEVFPSIHQKAARLGYGIIKNHPFIDGNKRIGTHAMLVFLALNKIELEYSQDDLAETILKVASSEYSFAVTWDNVNFADRTIIINKQLQWDLERKIWYLTPPKYNSSRTIDIDETIVELLKELQEKQIRAKEYYADEYSLIYYDEELGINESTGNVINFINVYENGGFIQPRTIQHTSSVIHKFYPAFTFHSLRHTHCTRLLEAGLPIKYVQERLGHKNISVTMDIYNHLTQNQAEQSKRALEDVFK